jgi:LSD1 subclass zinc finger protein
MDTKQPGKQKKINKELKCTGCGAILEFKPGTKNLHCSYCGAENIIQPSTEKIKEINYEDFIKNQFEKEEKVEVVSVRCSACGANLNLEPNISSDQCPYCASNIVVKSGSTSKVIKPKSLIPFAVNKNKAAQSFKTWIHKLWFAPSDLKKRAVNNKITGIYVPYWTYDANTQSDYTGQRGTYYYETQHYTTTENGKTVTKTRQVRRTRWTSVAGQVWVNFDDILVIASKSLPGKYTTKLEPWNLNELVPYNDKYLSGFRGESYQVNVVNGLVIAKDIMEPEIRREIHRDIGGDDQRISSMNTSYSNVTFKHILLPIWISSYKYRKKVYRFLINGQTGEVQGERPYSALKITLLVLSILAIIALIVILSQ